MPKFAIRVDASRAVGMGHLSRARAFAQYLAERQLEFTFFVVVRVAKFLRNGDSQRKKSCALMMIRFLTNRLLMPL